MDGFTRARRHLAILLKTAGARKIFREVASEAKI
jgi:hypothetical protein